MKRVAMAFVAICLVATASYAAPNLGTWTAPSQFSAGTWTETFYGGGPGQPGNVISASGPDWSLTGATLQGVLPYSNPPSPFNWVTTYTSGVLLLNTTGPWDGSGLSYTANLGPLTVWSTGDMGGSLIWHMQGSGIINGVGYGVILTADYSGTYTPLPPTGPSGMTGFITSAQISIVPAPAAILLCTFGTGLAGWLRRRRVL